jgi:hypothetical protein
VISELEHIKSLFWEEWDPIGVNDIPSARDEYDSYAFRVFVMLDEGAGAEQVRDYLDWAESTNMGLSQSRGRNDWIAERVLEIHRSAK